MAIIVVISSDGSARRLGQEPATPSLFETIRLGLVALWIAGAYAGIVYWSLQGSLLGVMASTVASIAAGGATWHFFIKLTDHENR